jgi:hypothetical protein
MDIRKQTLIGNYYQIVVKSWINYNFCFISLLTIDLQIKDINYTHKYQMRIIYFLLKSQNNILIILNISRIFNISKHLT